MLRIYPVRIIITLICVLSLLGVVFTATSTLAICLILASTFDLVLDVE